MKSQSDFLKFIIRSGFLAEGAVYLAVGLLALQVAVGFGGETGDTKGALEEIGRRPFGGTLLVILAVGLLHYSAWKFVEAFKDPENVGKGLRVWYGASGFLHIYLAYMAARTVLSGLGVMGGGQSGDQSAQSGTSWLMSQWFGRWLVGAVAVVASGLSISELWRATGRSSARNSRCATCMPGRRLRWDFGLCTLDVGLPCRSPVASISRLSFRHSRPTTLLTLIQASSVGTTLSIYSNELRLLEILYSPLAFPDFGLCCRADNL